MLLHSAFSFKSVVSALLIVALIAPSFLIPHTTLANLGGGADGSGGYDSGIGEGPDGGGGGTGEGGEGGEGEGDSGADSDGDGASDSSEADASAAAAESVSANATAMGVEGLSVEAVDAANDPNNVADPDNPNDTTVSVNGVEMSAAAANEAISSMAEAQSLGLSPATADDAPGYNTDATISANAQEPGVGVVGNMTGMVGPATSVAAAEIDAAVGYGTATNSVDDAVGLGIADSFGFTGPTSASVTDAPTAMGVVSTAAMGFPSAAQSSLPGTASPFGFDLSAVPATSVNTVSVTDTTPTSPYSSFQGSAVSAVSPSSYSGFMSADSFDDSPMANSFDNSHTPVGPAAMDVMSVPGIPTGLTIGPVGAVHTTNDLDAYNAYMDAKAVADAKEDQAFEDNDVATAVAVANDLNALEVSMFGVEFSALSYAPAETTAANTDTNTTGPTASTDTDTTSPTASANNDAQTNESVSIADQAISAVNTAISAVNNSIDAVVDAVMSAVGFNNNQTQTAQNTNQQSVNVSVISMTQAEMDAMFSPTSQQTAQNTQTAPTAPTTNTAPAQNTQTAPTTVSPSAQPTSQTPTSMSPTPMGPAQSFSPQNNQQVDTTSYTDQAGNQQTAQSRPETEADRAAGGQPGYSQQAYEGPESRQQAIDLVAALAVFENPANPASVAENVVGRAQNENQFPDTVTGVISAHRGTTYAYEPVGNFNGNLSAMVEAATSHPAWASAQAAASAVLSGATTPQTVVVSRNGTVAQIATHFVNPAVVQQRGASQSTQSWVNSIVNNPASVTVDAQGNQSHVHGIPAGEPGGQNLSPQPTVNEVGTTPVAPSAGFSAGTLGASPAAPSGPAATAVETTTAPPATAPQPTTTANEQVADAVEGVLGTAIDVAIGGPAMAIAQQGAGFLSQVFGNVDQGPAPTSPTQNTNPPAGTTPTSRVVMNNQNAVHRKQDIAPTLKAQLEYAARVANVTFVVTSGGQPSKQDVKDAKAKGMAALIGSRTGSSRHDHGNAADGSLVGADGRTLSFTNPNDLATFQTFIRAAVAAGATGVGAGVGYMGPQTIHVGGGSALSWGAGGLSSKAPGWLSEAHAQGLEDAKTFDPKNLTTPATPAANPSTQTATPNAPATSPNTQATTPSGPAPSQSTGPSISVSVPGANVTISLPGLGGPTIGQQIAAVVVDQVMKATGGRSGNGGTGSSAGSDGTPSAGGQPSSGSPASTPQSILDRIKAIIDKIMGDLFNGTDNQDENGGTATSTPPTSTSTTANLGDEQSALVINAAGLMINEFWQWLSGKTVRETYTNLPITGRLAAAEEPAYIPVLIRTDEILGTVELEELPVDDDLYLEDFEDTTGDDSASLVLAMDGSILYSDGTFAPIYNNGQMIDTGVEYIYLIERYRDGVLVSSEVNDAGLPGNGFTRTFRSFFSDTSPFTLEEVSTVTYSTIDPDIDLLDDEYKAYEITLHDGSVRRVEVPVTTSLEFYAEAFIKVGYQGDVNALISLGVEVSRKVTEYGPNIVERLRLLVSGEDDATSPYVDLSDIDILTGNRSAHASNIDAVNIYLNAELPCPAGYASSDGYLFQVTTPSGQVLGTMCGRGRSDSYAEAIAKEMNAQGYFEDVVSGRNLLPKMRFYFHEASAPIDLTAPVATTTTDTLPNVTNEITFEIKAVSSQGQTLIDWTNASSISIGNSVQLYFRWNGMAYQQCLAFLNDDGDYALRVTNRAMTTGNTENERYDVREASTTYRVECGGQRNNEFGVDDRSIRVMITQ